MKNIIVFLMLTIIPKIGFGQEVELITADNSKLPENNIWSIEVDRNGTKWIGTANSGLVSYKNGEFKTYNNSTSIFKGSYISPIFSDSNNKLWVSASKPNALYCIDNESLIKIENEILKSLGGVIAIAESENGIIYFGGSNGVVKYENDKWSKIKLPISSATVRTLAISKSGQIAIGHNTGLLIGKEGEFKVYKEDENELQLSVVRGLKYINEDKLIIGYGGGFGNGGFSIKNGDNWTHYNRENSRIANHMVRDIEVDMDEIFWLATNEGLTYYKEGKVDTIFFREGRMKNTIMDVAIDENTVWIATNFGVIQIKK